MSYCRFENTVQDLRDCFNHWELDEDASEYEVQAKQRLTKLCVNIALLYGDEIGEPVEPLDKV